MNLDEIKKYAEFEIFTRDKSSNIENTSKVLLKN